MKIHGNRDLGEVVRKYDYTAKLGRDRWAWEFLRRDAGFRDIARRHSSDDHVSRRPGPFPGVTLPAIPVMSTCTSFMSRRTLSTNS